MDDDQEVEEVLFAVADEEPLPYFFSLFDQKKNNSF